MHTFTPVEELRDCRNDGMTSSSGDYFSMQKHSQMLSPDPTPYEAHGYLPLCSVAAVAENAVDYFVNRSDASTESAGLSENTDSCILKSVDDGEQKSIQTQQLEGYVHASHLPLSKPSHQTKIVIKQHGFVSGPGEDIEIGVRSSNGGEQHEGECIICDSSCTGRASLEIDGTQSEVPIEKISVEGNPVSMQDRMIGKVVTEGQNKFHALAKETRWMKDQEDYQTFTAKLTDESQRKKCRQEDRNHSLEKCCRKKLEEGHMA
jgi:hypothetical protein